jgi:hypothetical protein
LPCTQVTVVVGLVHARPPRANVVLALLVHNTVRRVGRMHTSRMLDKVAKATRHPTGQQAIFYALPVSVTEFPQQSKLSTHVSTRSTPPSDTKRNFKNAANSGRHLNSPTDFAPNHPHPHASVAAPWQDVYPTPQPSCFAGPIGPANTGWDASVVARVVVGVSLVACRCLALGTALPAKQLSCLDRQLTLRFSRLQRVLGPLLWQSCALHVHV